MFWLCPNCESTTCRDHKKTIPSVVTVVSLPRYEIGKLAMKNAKEYHQLLWMPIKHLTFFTTQQSHLEVRFSSDWKFGKRIGWIYTLCSITPDYGFIILAHLFQPLPSAYRAPRHHYHDHRRFDYHHPQRHPHHSHHSIKLTSPFSDHRYNIIACCHNFALASMSANACDCFPVLLLTRSFVSLVRSSLLFVLV